MLLAGLAEGVLGYFRDWRFVLPALRSTNPDHRLAGVACLAFLWEHQAHRDLNRLALEDPEPGIRQAALWAYAFSHGTEVADLCLKVMRTEHDARARSFAEELHGMVSRGEGSFWRM
jgi:hypothetical protein